MQLNCHFKTFQVYSSWKDMMKREMVEMNFKTFQVYSSFYRTSVILFLASISKLFKFIVHVIIIILICLLFYFKTFQVYSSSKRLRHLIDVYTNFKTFQVYNS